MGTKVYLCLLNLLFLALLANGNPVAGGDGDKVVLCYFEAVSAKKPHQEVRFFPEDFDLNLCTHVVYNRLMVGEDLRVTPRDRHVDLREDDGLGLVQRTVALKEQKPGLKVILDLYDYDGVIKNKTSTKNQESLETFAKNVVDYIQEQGFDGINFRARENEGFEEVIPVLSGELKKKGLILMTFMLPRDPEFNPGNDMVEEMSRNFDLIVVGSYWALPRQGTAIFSPINALISAVDEYTSKGIPSEKLVVAIPAFCVSLILCEEGDEDDDEGGAKDGGEFGGLNSSVCGPGNEGIHEEPELILYHSEILRKISNTTEGWVIRRDEETGGQFGYSKTRQWTSFEDPVSVAAKASLVLQRNMAGIAMMNSDMEDFKGAFTENGETFPLTRAAHSVFHAGE
ncbi:probable chitinase 10 [Ischnura elegans]|uniref:probable chitinase 10 n=1 Tax=Ischnura elegans TaxID=197161 RepID=UPI001ED881FC|nr:probable chitinase 10 [Ischnura elegans]